MVRFGDFTRLLLFLAASAGLVIISGLLAFVAIAYLSLAAWFGENAPLAERALDNGIALWLLALNGGNAVLAVVAGATAFRRYTGNYTGRRRQGIRYAALGIGFLALTLAIVIAARQGYLSSVVTIGFFPLLLIGVAVRTGVYLTGKVDLERPSYRMYGAAIALPASGLASGIIMIAIIAASPALAEALEVWLLLAIGVAVASAATALLAFWALLGRWRRVAGR